MCSLGRYRTFTIVLLTLPQTCMKPLKGILGLKASVILCAIKAVVLEAQNVLTHMTRLPPLPPPRAVERGRGSIRTLRNRVNLPTPVSPQVKAVPKDSLCRVARIRLPAQPPSVISIGRGIVLTKRAAAICTVAYLLRMQKRRIIPKPTPT